MLPKIPGRYLVTVEVYKNETITYMANFNNGEFDRKNVIAWRQVPLPYPYKRGWFYLQFTVWYNFPKYMFGEDYSNVSR